MGEAAAAGRGSCDRWTLSCFSSRPEAHWLLSVPGDVIGSYVPCDLL